MRQNIHVIGRGWEYGKNALRTQCPETGPDQWTGCREGTQPGGGHSMQGQKHEKWRLDAGKLQSISQKCW